MLSHIISDLLIYRCVRSCVAKKNTKRNTDLLLKLAQLLGRQRVRLGNHRQYICTGPKLSHEHNVNFTESVSIWSDKVKDSVHARVDRLCVSLDPRLFVEDIVKLFFDVRQDFLEAGVCVKWFV